MKRILNFPFLLTVAIFFLSSALLPKSKIIEDAEKISHSTFNVLLSTYVNDLGVVNYPGFKGNESFQAYLSALSAAKPNNNNWSKNEKLAFWINAYNAFTIKLINDNWPVKSIRDISNPWKQKNINIGEDVYDLNSIEHEILRKMQEPRIHFAIVCASYSCPRLLNEAYKAKKIESQLEAQTISFINDSKRNKITDKDAGLSRLFKWFKSDFTAKGTLIEYINKYSAVKINKDASVNYLIYNWSLNNK